MRILLILLLCPILIFGQAAAAAKKKDLVSGPSCPGDVCTNLVAWYIAGDYDGDGNPANNSGDVETWVDLSGNGWDLSQATASLRPTYTTSVVNGEAGLDFESADPNWMRVSSVTDLDNENDLAIFYVVDTDSEDDFSNQFICSVAANSEAQWVIGGVNFVHSIFAQPNVEVYDGSNGQNSTLASQNGTSPAYGYFTNYSTTGDTLTVHWNGLPGTGTNLSFITDLGTNQYFQVGRTTKNSNYWNGKIMEVIIYKYLTPTEQQTVESYLATKYGF